MDLTLPLISAMQARRYTIGMTGDSPAGQMKPFEEDLQAQWHFYCEAFTVSYPTLTLEMASPVDDGVTRLAARFRDKNHSIGLTGETPLDLSTLSAPGRQRSPGVTGDPSQSLHIRGMRWPHFYAAKGGIIVELFNNGVVSYDPGQINFTFWGFLIPKAVVPDDQAFWDICLSTSPTLAAKLALQR